jgi:class 3 adenylate cyclase
MNQAEVTTSFVDAFALKGFTEPVPVYRVEQRHRTHVLADRYIVITDIRGFSAIAETSQMTVVEDILDRLHELISRVCRDFGGTHHFGAGDGQFLTFSEPGRAMAAVERLTEEWGKSTGKQRCPMNVAVHKGTLYAYRSYLFGRAMNETVAVEIATHLLVPTDVSIFVSGPVRQDLAETPWQDQLHRVDIAGTTSRLAEIAIYRLEKPKLEAARAI